MNLSQTTSSYHQTVYLSLPDQEMGRTRGVVVYAASLLSIQLLLAFKWLHLLRSPLSLPSPIL